MITSHTYKLSAYPKQMALHEGKEVILKPMTRDDGEALLDFFVRIPAEERYYLKDELLAFLLPSLYPILRRTKGCRQEASNSVPG